MDHKMRAREMKLWDGDYTTEVHEQIWARNNFFSAVGYFAPETITSLIANVFDAYKAARGKIETKWPSWEDIKDIADESDPRCELKLKVRAWADNYNIGESGFEDIEDAVCDPATWALSGALNTMEQWYRSPDAERKGLHRSWLQKPPLNYRDQMVKLSTTHPTTYVYQPFVELREKAKERVMEDLEKQVDKELNRIEAEVEKNSYYQTRTRKTIEQDLTWFVRFQVQGWSVPKILKEYGLSGRKRNRVYDSLNRAQSLLAAKRRVGKPGRPKLSDLQ